MNFWENASDEGVEDLIDSLDDLAEAEVGSFVEKWSKVNLSSPATNWNFPRLLDDLRDHHQDIIGPEGIPMENSAELRETLGDLAEPLVDYVNMTRRMNIKRAIKTYVHLGYLEPAMTEDGSVEYLITDKVDKDDFAFIWGCVAANARF